MTIRTTITTIPGSITYPPTGCPVCDANQPPGTYPLSSSLGGFPLQNSMFPTMGQNGTYRYRDAAGRRHTVTTYTRPISYLSIG